jgi:CheY-like chemotaxis protein
MTTPNYISSDCTTHQGRPQSASKVSEIPEPQTLPLGQTAHDLANFLTGIRMLIQSLSRVASNNPAVQQHIASLRQAALHAAELCDQLQASLRGDEEDLELETCQVEFGATLTRMERLLEVMIPSDTSLDLQLAANLPPIVANPTQLRQIVLDLVSNASDALGNGGSITIRTGIARCSERPDLDPLGPEPDDAFVFMEVADTGCGIDKESLRKIFEPSFTTKSDGQGLGLASVLNLVQGYGGAVHVDSRVGEGTRVRCLFPRAVADRLRTAEPAAAPNRGHETTVAGPATLLLVDDNTATRDGIALMLKTSDRGEFHVLAAGNGREAMSLFRERRQEISLVVLDEKLPDCRGTQLFRQMRQIAGELPVIIATGLPKNEVLAECHGEAPDGFLVKPFDGDELIQAMNNVLRD